MIGVFGYEGKEPSEAAAAARGSKKKARRIYGLYLVVVAILVSSILRGEYENAAICLLVLFLFLLPLFVQKNFGIELPSTLEIIILVFIFASEILGELGCFFINVPNWDSILHTTTGFLCAAFGFALIDILNRNDKIKFQLSLFMWRLSRSASR